MAQARLWLWGLIPLAVLWVLTVAIETGPVERDIGARTRAELSAGTWLPADIVTHGRDVTLAGDAFDPTDRLATVATTSEVRGVRRVDDQSHLIPESKPYGWSASKNATALSFQGVVPEPKTRADLVALARAGGATVTDATTFARGGPDQFDAAAALALAQLQALTQGKVSLTDDTFSISGVAKDHAAHDAIIAALRALPGGFKVGETDVTVASYEFAAMKEASTGTLTFEGSVPDDGTRQAILAVAQGAFAGQKVIDNIKLAPGAPPGFAASATAALRQLSRLDSGKLTMSDRAVALSGRALYGRAIDQIRTALQALPAGFAAKAELQAQPPASSVDAAACQQLFADQLAKGKIQFETASAKIDTTSAGLLDHLAAAALRCPAQTVEISGHTDAKGSDAVNLDLSKRRAQAVVDYLVAAGIEAGHLTAVGYGKTRPIAPNDTEEGMAKNRRIEFLVK